MDKKQEKKQQAESSQIESQFSLETYLTTESSKTIATEFQEPPLAKSECLIGFACPPFQSYLLSLFLKGWMISKISTREA